MSTAYLVNVVHNNFKDAEAIFKPFYEAGERYAAQKASMTNGLVNGAH
jgi:methylenetetrahydrofolate reductase (NADPH)